MLIFSNYSIPSSFPTCRTIYLPKIIQGRKTKQNKGNNMKFRKSSILNTQWTFITLFYLNPNLIELCINLQPKTTQLNFGLPSQNRPEIIRKKGKMKRKTHPTSAHKFLHRSTCCRRKCARNQPFRWLAEQENQMEKEK